MDILDIWPKKVQTYIWCLLHFQERVVEFWQGRVEAGYGEVVSAVLHPRRNYPAHLKAKPVA